MQVDVLLCIMISPLILILELYGLFFCTCTCTVTTITQTLDLCNSFFLRLTQIYMCCLNLSRTTLVLSMQLRWEFWLLGVDEGGREQASEQMGNEGGREWAREGRVDCFTLVSPSK